MSRIGRRPIPVPAGVNVAIDGRTVVVKGPKGELSHTLAEPITIERDGDGHLHVNRPNDERRVSISTARPSEYQRGSNMFGRTIEPKT